jgi:hypothetical protein
MNDYEGLPKSFSVSLKVLGITKTTKMDETEELISNYISDKYGFLHKGFSYGVAYGNVFVYDIKWETN